MKTRLWIAIWMFAATFSFAAPVDGLLTEGGVWSKTKSRLVVKSPLSLKEDTEIIADEIILQSPIVTNGHRLMVVARSLIWERDASIRGFEPVPPPPEGAAAAYSEPAAKGKQYGGKGADGAMGKPGAHGRSGMGAEGALPKEILIFAAHIAGVVRIDGTGQMGGNGGKGGKGQDGGQGGRGSAAVYRERTANTPAGNGGDGGAAGHGGPGGAGGKGGAPVPYQLLTVQDSNAETFTTDILCKPGAGGAGGEVGEPGKPGVGGIGGIADTGESGSEPGGVLGKDGAVADNSEAYRAKYGGKAGNAPEIEMSRWMAHLNRSTPDFKGNYPVWETKRQQVMGAFSQLHWWRLYERIARASFELMNESKFDADAVAVIVERWTRTLVGPLRGDLENIGEETGSRVEHMEQVLNLASAFTSSVHTAAVRGFATKTDIEDMTRAVDAIAQNRLEVVQRLSARCAEYEMQVLNSKEFASRKVALLGYFEIPACNAIAKFQRPEGTEEPIELNAPFKARLHPPFKDAVEISAIQKACWLANQILSVFSIQTAMADEFRTYDIQLLPNGRPVPSVAPLEIHRGFVAPASKPSLESLGRDLIHLYKLLLKRAK